MCIKVPQIEIITPFAGSLLQQPVGKISVNMPTDDWLCKKLDKLNLTVVKGYPSRNSEAGGLQHDQYMKTPKFHSKWYGLHTSRPCARSFLSAL